jgi:hypothetical protein
VEKFRSLSPVLLAAASDKVSQVPSPGAPTVDERTPVSCGLEESRPMAIPSSTPCGAGGPPERAAAAAGPPHGSGPPGSPPGRLKAASSPAFHPGDGSPTGSVLDRSPPSSLACPAVSCEPLLGPASEAGSVKMDAVQGGRPSLVSPAASSLVEDRDPPPLATPPTSSPRPGGLLHLLLPCLARH